MNTAAAAPSPRRYDVDSLRVLALALLIFYHVLLVYSGREFWRVSSAHHGYWADYLIATLTPWRMSLVFLIGGIAVRFMFSRPSFGAFVRERAARLLVAFAFAVIVLVPPQRYVRLEALGENAGVDYFTYLVRDAPFAVHYLGIDIPQLGHAWFLPYLFAYSCAAGVLWWFLPKAFATLERLAARVPAPAWLFATMAWFSFIESFFSTHSTGDRLFFTDWGGHAKFIPIFLLGVLLGQNTTFQKDLNRGRLAVWAGAATMLLVSLGFQWLVLHGREDLRLWWLISRGLYGGSMLWSVVAFGQWALSRPSRALTYASDAILPVYLMHQTVLILIANIVLTWGWPLPAEMATLLVSASVLPLVLYHVLVRRTPWLRFLFGLRPRLRSMGSPSRAPEQPNLEAVKP